MEDLRYISTQRTIEQQEYEERQQRQRQRERERRRRESTEKRKSNTTEKARVKSSETNSEERRNRNKNRKKRSKIKFFSIRSGMDMPFFFLLLVLLVIGIAMMFSASYAYSYYNNDGDSYLYLRRQAIFALIGVAGMIGVSFFDYRYLHSMAKYFVGLAFILLVLVLFMPAVNNVHRWINIGPLSFQASEILKFAIVVFYASWSYSHFDKMSTFKYGVLPAVVLAVPAVLLLIKEPHYSCVVIVVLLFAIMMFISGVKIRWFIFGISGVIVIFSALYLTDNLQYAMERLDGWGMALNDDLSSDMQWTVWQTMNSLYAIGSGGLTGLGLGQSREKYLYLPEPQNDFVFAIVVEELGLIGGFIILAIFIMFIIRGIMISLRAKDRFGMLLGVGLVSQIGLQVVLNILVITDTLPNTGISLPFFSYGGTSLVMLLLQMGIVLSISRNSNINKT